MGYWEEIMKHIDVTRYVIETDKIQNSKGFKFVLLSDLHSNSYGIDLHYVNRIISSEKPDAVLCSGDMFNRSGKDKPQDVLNYLTTLAKHFPVFYGIGNHEYDLMRDVKTDGERFCTIRDRLSEAGVCFLEDETVYLDKDNDRIALSGVMIDSAFYSMRGAPIMGSGLMDKHLGMCDGNMYNLLIAHNPDYFNNYSDWGADLVVSGHIHGGIIRVLGLGGLISPKVTLFPKFDGGMYYHSDSIMLVSRGLGAHTVNFRFNNNPEVVVFRIMPKGSKRG